MGEKELEGRGSFLIIANSQLNDSTEFLNDVRIHDAHGPDKTPTRDRPARCESAENRKGD